MIPITKVLCSRGKMTMFPGPCWCSGRSLLSCLLCHCWVCGSKASLLEFLSVFPPTTKTRTSAGEIRTDEDFSEMPSSVGATKKEADNENAETRETIPYARYGQHDDRLRSEATQHRSCKFDRRYTQGGCLPSLPCRPDVKKTNDKNGSLRESWTKQRPCRDKGDWYGRRSTINGGSDQRELRGSCHA